jgi:hypothetical protein
VLAKQALYHLSHTSRPFGSSSFGNRGLTFGLGQPELQILLSTLPTIAGMTGMHHHTQPFLLSWLGVGGGSQKLLLRLIWNMILPISVSQAARITGMNHHAWLVPVF